MDENIKVRLSQYYFAYIDILGISNAIRSENSNKYLMDIYDLYKDVKKAVTNTNSNRHHIKVITKIFSDNIIIAIEKAPYFNSINEIMKQYLIIEMAAYFQLLGLKYSFLIRGAITCGDLFINEDFVYGKALLDGYNIESNNAIYPRIVIDNNVVNEYIQNKSIKEYLKKDTDGMCYVDSFFTYFTLLKEYNIDKEIEYIRNFLLQQITEEHNSRIIQKKYWIVNKFNDFCLNHNHNNYIIDISKFPYNPNYTETIITGNAPK